MGKKVGGPSVSQPKTRKQIAIAMDMVSLQLLENMFDARAELSKSCWRCRYFGVRTLDEGADESIKPHWCHESPREVPADGFCHKWAK